MSIRVAAALAAVALLAPSASAQSLAAPGPTVGLGSSAPEQTLFRNDATPILSAGLRLGRGVAVEVGAEFRNQTRLFRSSRDRPPNPATSKASGRPRRGR